jgi:hypothetical protein
VKDSRGFLHHLLAMTELALVVPHRLDRSRVGAGESRDDFLGAESVVSRHRFASAHVAKLLEHGRPVPVRAFMGLDRCQFDLRELSELLRDVLGV